eukprot:2690565-Lingulodinium_polyedra.AAC.1
MQQSNQLQETWEQLHVAGPCDHWSMNRRRSTGAELTMPAVRMRAGPAGSSKKQAPPSDGKVPMLVQPAPQIPQ